MEMNLYSQITWFNVFAGDLISREPYESPKHHWFNFNGAALVAFRVQNFHVPNCSLDCWYRAKRFQFQWYLCAQERCDRYRKLVVAMLFLTVLAARIAAQAAETGTAGCHGGPQVIGSIWARQSSRAHSFQEWFFSDEFKCATAESTVAALGNK